MGPSPASFLTRLVLHGSSNHDYVDEPDSIPLVVSHQGTDKFAVTIGYQFVPSSAFQRHPHKSLPLSLYYRLLTSFTDGAICLFFLDFLHSFQLYVLLLACNVWVLEKQSRATHLSIMAAGNLFCLPLLSLAFFHSRHFLNTHKTGTSVGFYQRNPPVVISQTDSVRNGMT